MNTLHCILTTEYAGSEAYCCQLARMQAKAGHSVRVIVRDAGAAYVARVRQEAAPAPVLTIPRWVPSLLEGWVIGAMMRGFEPDILHTHLGRATKRAGAAAKCLRVPHVATLHLEWRNDYAVCDGVICIADWQKAGIPNDYKGKVAKIWNWVPQGQRHKVKDIRKRRVSSHVSDLRPLTFLSVGRLVPNKGMDILIQAFKKAFPKGTERVALTLAGDGPQRGELERLAAGDSRIALVGYRDDVAELYTEADVYVSAARYEPFGLTILEAMQAGCGLVCTQTQGPMEFLHGMKNVVWAAVNDVDSLARALQKKASEKPQRTAWELEAFRPSVATKKIEHFYGDVIKASH